MTGTGTTSRWARSVVIVGVVTLLSSCGGSTSKSENLGATVKEFSVTLSSSSVRAGQVRLDIENAGTVEHELVAFRTTLDEASLPLDADGAQIDEEGAGITHLDPEAEGLKPGKTKTIRIGLTPGSYVLACNLPGHYGQGMHAPLTVT